MKFKDTKYGDLTGQSINDNIYLAFGVTNKRITSLEGSPKEVNGRGGMIISNNDLTSLKYAPEKIVGEFDCSMNNITTLEGCPKYIGRKFDCSNNGITSFKGIGECKGDISVSDNSIKSFDGCPTTVNGDFNCSGNLLTSLEGAPRLINGVFDIRHNDIKDVKTQIIVNQVKARAYATDEGGITFKSIQEDFELYSKDKLIQRKGFRTLLGLK